MRKKLLSLLLLSVLVASTLAGCGQGQPTASPAICSASEGNVSVMREGTATWMEAEVGMALEPADVIKCSDNSSAKITFLDGSTIELQAGTEIEIISLNISTETDSSTIRLKQTIGSIIFRVTKIIDPASRYEVETPVGSVVVRGSAVQVSVSEDGTTWACNLEGDIWAIAQGVELQVPEGRCCVIRPGQPPQLEVEVTFADPNLEAVIREAIAKPRGPIYASDLDGFTHLDAALRSISNLSGLEHCTTLAGLDLNYNQISDISALTNLTSLTYLYLWNNQISDISPLGSLTNLTELQVGRAQISDISPLADLSSLTVLGLWHNQISDISPLADLTNLVALVLEDNQISDISPLTNLTSLTVLGLHHNQISDILPLVQNAGLGAGDRVWLHDNPLSSDSINIYIPQLQARGVDVEYLRLLSPATGAMGVPITNVDFTWTEVTSADAFDWVLSKNADLSSPVDSKTGLSSAACTYTGTLDYASTYYWQVKAYRGGVAISESAVGSFTTITPAP